MFPDPGDVRLGVDNGNGQTGTLVLPEAADVRRGVGYGADGTEYTGSLPVPSSAQGGTYPAIWFRSLYPAQTNRVGIEIKATIQGFCEDAPAIISEVNLDEIFIQGGRGENGGWEIQIRLSDLSGEPPKGTSITCNGEASGAPLEVLNFKRNNGIGYITAADFSAQNQ